MGKRGRQSPTPPLEQLVTQVRITNTLLAAQLQQHMTQQAIVGLLRGAGASLQDIADILGTSYAAVAVASGRLKKHASKGHPDGDTSEEGTPETDLREPGDGPERS